MTRPLLAILLLLPLSVSAGASAQTTSLLCVSASGFVDGTPISNPEGKKFAVTVLKIGGETLVEGFGNQGLWISLTIFLILRALTLVFYFNRIYLKI